jgi:hypothetical protein
MNKKTSLIGLMLLVGLPLAVVYGLAPKTTYAAPVLMTAQATEAAQPAPAPAETLQPAPAAPETAALRPRRRQTGYGEAPTPEGAARQLRADADQRVHQLPPGRGGHRTTGQTGRASIGYRPRSRQQLR